MGPPHEGSIRRPIAPRANALSTELHFAPIIAQWVHPVKDRSDRPIAPRANALTTELHLAPIIAQWGPPREGSIRSTHRTTSERSYHGATFRSYNSSMGPPHEGSIRRPIAPRANALTTELLLAPIIAQWVHPVKDRSDDPSHHERTLLPRSYISLHERAKTRGFFTNDAHFGAREVQLEI